MSPTASVYNKTRTSERMQFNNAGSGSRIQGRCRCGACGGSNNGGGGGHSGGGGDQRNDGSDEEDWATCLEQKQMTLGHIGWWRAWHTCG